MGRIRRIKEHTKYGGEPMGADFGSIMNKWAVVKFIAESSCCEGGYFFLYIL